MAELTIDYDNLQGIIDSANTLAVKAESYYESLQNNVINSFGGVTAGVNDVLESAQYYVKAKKQQLVDKANEYATFANNVGVLMAHAKQADLDVATKIENNQEDFLKNHSEIKAAEGIEAFLLNLFVEVKNANPLFEIVADIYVYAFDKLTDAFESLKYWYRCEGGKEWLELAATVVIGVALVVIAIATIIATFPLTCALLSLEGIVGIASCIGAGMAAFDGVADISAAALSVYSAENGDPAWAKIYGDTNSISDAARLHNFGNKNLNKASMLFADGWDITETACDVINICDSGKKIFTKGSDLFKRIRSGAFGIEMGIGIAGCDWWLNNSPTKLDGVKNIVTNLAKNNLKSNDAIKLFISDGLTRKEKAKGVKTIAKMVITSTKFSREVDKLTFGEISIDKFNSDRFENLIKKNDVVSFGYDLYDSFKPKGTFPEVVDNNYFYNMYSYIY